MSQAEANQVVGDAIWNGMQSALKYRIAMGMPGVTFTLEQRTHIEAIVEAGDMVAAQKIILDLLEVSFANQS